MKKSNIVFSKSSKEQFLKLFRKTTDDEGFIVEEEDSTQRVLTKKGEEIHIKEWAGVVNGSEEFVKSDIVSLVDIAKRL